MQLPCYHKCPRFHTSIRVRDTSIGIDVAYNYGVFDFDDPDFYIKFTRGKLLYRLARHHFDNFLYGYEIENRWVKEQVLNLSLAEKNELLAFLENNYLPENRYYKYDFLFDNCSTRVPDALKKVVGKKLNFREDHFEHLYTFRELIHQNLELNSWSNFGIDLALGSVIDRKASPREHMFLPIYVFKQLRNTTLEGEPFVVDENSLFEKRPEIKEFSFFLTPIFWLATVLVVVILISYYDHKNEKRSRGLDFSLFLITGLAGVLILFLWLGTDHTATAKNLNALWAFAPNSIIAFILLRKNPPLWLRKYMGMLLILLMATVVIWILKIQVFSLLLIFLLAALAIRYVFLISFLGSKKQYS